MTARLLAAADVAALVQCSEDYAYAIIKREMKYRKIGTLLRVAESDFWQWFNANKREPCASTSEGNTGGAATPTGAAPRAVRRAVRRRALPCSSPNDGSASEPIRITQPRRPRRSLSADGYVYFVAEAGGLVKIGSSRSPRKRIAGLQTGSPLPLSCLGVAPGGRALERSLHGQFGHLRRQGEWFSPAPELLELIGSLPKVAL